MMVVARGVGREYRQGAEVVRALHGVDIAVEPGELLAVTGASGSGKSTLLALLGALDRPTAGALEVLGVDVITASAERLARLRREGIGFVFQDFRLVSHLTVRDNVALPLFFGAPAAGAEDVDRLLDALGIAHRKRHRPEALSRGEMQRTALARALVARPRLLIADEPTASLDATSSAALWRLLAAAKRERGLTVVIATHQPEAVAEVSRVVRLRGGEVVEER